MVGKHYNCPFSFFPLPLRKKKEHVHLMLTWGLSRERGHERCHEQSCMIFFRTEMRQTFHAMWRCISLRLNAVIFSFFRHFSVKGRDCNIHRTLFLADSFDFVTKGDDDGK